MKTVERELRDPDTEDRRLVGRLLPVHKKLLASAMDLGDQLAVVGGTRADEATEQQEFGSLLRNAAEALLRIETNFAKTDPPPRKKAAKEPSDQEPAE